MAKVSTNITIDAEVKKQAQELFADLGMDLSTAINVFLKKALAEQGIPFEVSREIPNSVTAEAMDEFDEMMVNPGKYKRYSSFKDALNEVL
ncbi:MAG: type II toxin-antitoxin system RelB/DinJ family antitoxin [Clostridiales bacterium]|nr:type II toxin-antitoxin system RelB/DinJ family antitoxin [Clostridiales bacterium]